MTTVNPQEQRSNAGDEPTETRPGAPSEKEPVRMRTDKDPDPVKSSYKFANDSSTLVGNRMLDITPKGGVPPLSGPFRKAPTSGKR